VTSLALSELEELVDAPARAASDIQILRDGAAAFPAMLELIDGADFLVESRGEQAMSTLGLGYEELAARNPALVYVSITPFGQEGPKAHWAATDLTLLAAGGFAARGRGHARALRRWLRASERGDDVRSLGA